jgi:hypothetical protein
MSLSPKAALSLMSIVEPSVPSVNRPFSFSAQEIFSTDSVKDSFLSRQGKTAPKQSPTYFYIEDSSALTGFTRVVYKGDVNGLQEILYK